MTNDVLENACKQLPLMQLLRIFALGSCTFFGSISYPFFCCWLVLIFALGSYPILLSARTHFCSGSQCIHLLLSARTQFCSRIVPIFALDSYAILFSVARTRDLEGPPYLFEIRCYVSLIPQLKCIVLGHFISSIYTCCELVMQHDDRMRNGGVCG